MYINAHWHLQVSSILLNFMLLHPLFQKHGTIIGMIDRIFLLSHPSFYFKNNFIVNTLLNNDYPIKFIFETIRARLKSLLARQTYKQTKDNNSSDLINEKTSWFTISYILHISDKFKNITRDLGVRMSFFSLNKLGRLIKVQKDILWIIR